MLHSLQKDGENTRSVQIMTGIVHMMAGNSMSLEKGKIVVVLKTGTNAGGIQVASGVVQISPRMSPERKADVSRYFQKKVRRVTLPAILL